MATISAVPFLVAATRLVSVEVVQMLWQSQVAKGVYDHLAEGGMDDLGVGHRVIVLVA